MSNKQRGAGGLMLYDFAKHPRECAAVLGMLMLRTCLLVALWVAAAAATGGEAAGKTAAAVAAAPPAAEQPAAAAGAVPPPAPAPAAGETPAGVAPERFNPTEEVSEDWSVAFPTDI